jgi:hypothetical protein
VQLPRLYLAWLTPRQFGRATPPSTRSPPLAGGRTRGSSRLVYDMQIAQDVSPSRPRRPVLVFQIIATPQPGHTVAELRKVIDEELQRLQRETAHRPRARRSVNQVEASFTTAWSASADSAAGGSANALHQHGTRTGSTSPRPISGALGRRRQRRGRLPLDKRVELIVEPEKKP